jgi:hypothetical protein
MSLKSTIIGFLRAIPEVLKSIIYLIKYGKMSKPEEEDVIPTPTPTPIPTPSPRPPATSYVLSAHWEGYSVYGFTVRNYGSMTPSTFNGVEIYSLTEDPAQNNKVTLGIREVVSQDFLKSVKFDGQDELLASNATFSSNVNGGNGYSSWTWTLPTPYMNKEIDYNVVIE